MDHYLGLFNTPSIYALTIGQSSHYPGKNNFSDMFIFCIFIIHIDIHILSITLKFIIHRNGLYKRTILGFFDHASLGRGRKIDIKINRTVFVCLSYEHGFNLGITNSTKGTL